MQNTDYKARQRMVLDKMSSGIAIIPSSIFMHKSNDTEFPFRQNSNFKYLTGVNEPDCILVLSQKDGVEKSYIFARPNNALQEMWMGKRLGLDGMKEMIEADRAFNIADFDEEISNILPGHRNLYIHFSEREDIFNRVRSICGDLYNKKRSAQALPPRTIQNVGSIIEELRMIKDQNEIQMMKTAMIATDRAHRAAMAFSKAGKSEKEVNSLINYIFSNGKSQGSAYDNIVAGGNNANILHYIENNQELNDGELLLIDAGSQLNLYATDITRTFPINGTFSPIQAEVYQIVLEAQKAAISHTWVGRTNKELQDAASKILAQGLKDLKVSEESVETIIENGTLRTYYPHGIGHWLGLDVHDQNPYLDEADRPMKFKENSIITIEPGLYFPQEDPSLPENLKGIGIRIEDNIIIKENGPENISSMIPKEIKEIEEACKQDFKDFIL